MQCIQDHRRHIGLIGGKIVGEQEMNEIADLEDECIVKMRELTSENLKRKNALMSEQYENYQKNRIERKQAAIDRSNINPALLWQI